MTVYERLRDKFFKHNKPPGRGLPSPLQPILKLRGHIIDHPHKFSPLSDRIRREKHRKIDLSPAANLLPQFGHKHGLKNIKLSKRGHATHKRSLSFQQMNRNLAIYNTRWWIVGLAIIVLISGFNIYPQQDIGGGQAETGTNRYKTIAQLASTAEIDDFNNPLNNQEYSMPVDASGDYLFKTGGIDTIISRSSRKETIKYVVRSGETLNTLANDFGITALTLKYANNLSTTAVRTGQELRIPPIDGLYITIKRGDTLSSLANRYKVSMDDIQKYNGLTADDSITTGQELLIPGAVMPKAQTAPVAGSKLNLPAYNPVPYSGQFVWPTTNPTKFISQKPRSGHMALDLNKLNGLGIYASAAGIVHTKVTIGGYGRLITINHGGGWETYYGHLSQYIVKEGDHVEQGQLIAVMGSTGRSTGTHLHFEIRQNNKLLNPLNYLP